MTCDCSCSTFQTTYHAFARELATASVSPSAIAVDKACAVACVSFCTATAMYTTRILIQFKLLAVIKVATASDLLRFNLLMHCDLLRPKFCPPQNYTLLYSPLPPVQLPLQWMLLRQWHCHWLGPGKTAVFTSYKDDNIRPRLIGFIVSYRGKCLC